MAGRTLCVSDGEGRNSVFLAGLGHQVDAFDLAELGVNKARQLAAQAQAAVHFEVCDWRDFHWTTQQYDNVVAIFIQFADPTARAELFERMQSTLRPEGRLLLLGYGPKQLEYKTGGPPFLDHLYTPALLESAFPALETELLTAFEDVLSEGDGHKGRSDLVGYIGRKTASGRDTP
ncbi:MAG: hypothetical protein RLY30_859 [Pseudomonadota bacterium]|jgi:cyclopropane fatty-acyl-phospholipid synthase-like methyltransferase